MRRALASALAAVVTASCLSVAAGTVPAHAQAKAKQRSGNAAYSWWTSPTMARTSKSLYFTGVNSQGYQRVYRWTRDRKHRLTLTYVNLRKGHVDDHNAPALSMSPGRPSLVFYTDHPGTMYVRRTKTHSDPVLKKKTSSFGSAVKMPFELKTTYVQVLRDRDRVVVLARYLQAGQSGWYYVTSSNSGASWSAPRELFDSENHQAYLLMRATDRDPSALHVMAYWHPKYGPDNVVGYRRLTFEDLWNGRAERFTVSGMERVWASDPDGPAGQQVRLLDGGDKRSRPMVFIATWDSVAKVPVYRQMVRAADGSWSSNVIRSAGATFGSGNGYYVPGVSLDQRRGKNRIYFGYRTGSSWRLGIGLLGTDGRVKSTGVLQTSKKPIARPIVAGRDLMFQQLSKYSSYKRFLITVHTLPLG